ncbi:beta-lactamase family protein [Sphingomonas sp. So64.6b]|uniref:serine hydrolase domain-containing protein n=1 Tax=Sphingomonas sp. So64.6b TaxID=2997354 RepID=UPI00160097C0|nr:serine hydrolase domain-containing protein [Sphingomonas sp. So64.6b]QNA85588.1 beta-lactamase family protein [Sphingomonas sp. So64.6b]
MKAVRWYMVSAGALALLATGAVFAREAAPQTQPLVAAAAVSPLPGTQALLDSYVADNKMPGIVAAFGYRDRPTMFLSAGKIGDEATAAKAGPDSLWRVYSMTKPITGMAAMILIEDGKMSLDQPLSDFIPAFKNMKVQIGPDSLDSRPATRPITIRNLLTHTAGLGYTIVTKGPLLKEYERLGLTPAAVNAALEVESRKTRPATLEEFANRVASVPLIADPGTKWSYSIGLDVMGRVIEVASGMSFDSFVQKRIFDPLKMNSSYWTVPESELGRLSSNYIIVGENRAPLDPAATSAWLKPPSFPYGGAGLVMSARDYDRFLHMLQNYGELDGVRVMKADTARLAMSNLMPAGVFFPGAATATGGTSQPMGFGAGGSVAIADTPGGPAKGTYGWGGAAGTVAFVDPAHQVRGTVMVNYFPGDKWPLRTEVLTAFKTDLEKKRP